MKKMLLIILILFTTYNIYAKPTAVLFDCDGVIVDTEYMKFLAWQEALKSVKIGLTLNDYMQVVGESSEAIAKQIMQSKHVTFDAKAVIKQKNVLYKKEQIKGVPPIAAAVTYLNKLLTRKDDLQIKIAIVSSDTHEAILRNLQFAGVKYALLDGIFSGHDDLMHINDPTGTNKPKPYIYQLAAEKLNINPRNTVVFEDTNAGISAATTAGMLAIAIPNAFTKQQDFSKAKLITNFNDFTIQDLEKF